MLFQLVPPSSYAEALHTSGLFAHILKEIMEDKVLTLSICHILLLTTGTLGRYYDSDSRHLRHVTHSSARAWDIPSTHGCNFCEDECARDAVMGGPTGPMVA